jgi:hypothetical protein
VQNREAASSGDRLINGFFYEGEDIGVTGDIGGEQHQENKHSNAKYATTGR